MFSIYTLADPRDPKTIRYAGCTSQTPHARTVAHVWLARSGAKHQSSAWIRALLSDGVRPMCVVVGTTDDLEEAKLAEKALISCLRTYCVPITNTNAGGAIGVGSMSADGKRRIQAAWNTEAGVERRKNLSIAVRGRKYPNRKPHSHEVRVRTSRRQGGKPVVDEVGRRFETFADAARFHGIFPAEVRVAAMSGRPVKGHEFSYAEAEL